MIYQKIFPTNWPLFEFSIAIWRLHIFTALFSPSMATNTYEYIMMVFQWHNNDFFRIRLYDTYRRKEDRLGRLINNNEYSGDWSVEKLKEIRDIANKKIEELEK